MPSSAEHASFLTFLILFIIGLATASIFATIYQIPLNILSDVFQSSRQANDPSNGSLDSFLSTEGPIALQGILNNIGGTGSKAASVEAGLVIASPSKTNPDYFYSWTRDSALTFKALVDAFIAGNTALQTQIQDYIYAQASLQTVSSPSGSLSNGAGLGEPKFEVVGTAFTGAWGRPQRDGPALRATALIAYSRYLIGSGNTSTAANVVWPIIANDLSYVAQYWNQTGFDLWEEVQGSSFFTTAVQHRALVEGNAFAAQIGKTCSGCVSQAPEILCFLQSYWNGEFVLANINANNGRSSKDANSLLGSIHTFDPSAGCDDPTFQPCSPKALANHKVITDSFRTVFAINAGITEGTAVSVGRYPEDTYQGGNPWYISNHAAAEQLYDALYQWNKLGSITVTATSLEFFKDFQPSITAGTYASGSSTYTALTSAIRTYADGYLAIVQKYLPADGSIAEQFSRSNGNPLSAVDLTWSYASFITVVARRNGQVPASWGEPTANTAPSACSVSSAQGTYSAPPYTSPTSCDTVGTQDVTFNVAKVTTPGQHLYIVGNTSEFGNWDPSKGVQMQADSYTSTYPRWDATTEITIPTNLEYKYYINGEGAGYESGENRLFSVVASTCQTSRQVIDTWQN